MNNLISVIIPVFNREELIPRAIESIVRQDHPEKEVIVVDDGSSDHSAEAAERALASSGLPHQVIRLSRNGGVSRARNHGIKRALGQYISFLDSDDFCESTMLSSLFSRAGQNDRIDMVFCGYQKLFAESGELRAYPLDRRPIEGKTADEIAIARLFNRFEPALSSLIRRDLLLQNGLFFNESCYAGEDGEFFLKAIVRSRKIASISSNPYIYVQHKNTDRAERDPQKAAHRYHNNTLALARTLRDLIKTANSPRLRSAAEFYLHPMILQRCLAYAAMRKDRRAFDKMLKNNRCVKKMLSSYREIFAKPEIYLKTLALLAFPERYYQHYSRRFD